MSSRAETPRPAGAGIHLDDVIADLRDLHSTDRAARRAVDAIKLARMTLESFWPTDDTRRRTDDE